MEGRAYPYRGFMLDCARHFLPAESVCRFIEAAALCGMNRMHWHLTDDQGWRVEIKRYPRLTGIGSVRGPSTFWGADPVTGNCGYYTHDDIRRVVAFAAEKGVSIVPEIEIPGHASAMLAAYPEYGCRRTVYGAQGEQLQESPYDYRVAAIAGVFPNLVCAGKDEALRFLEDILDEIMALFPGPEIHIGGDEAIKLHWRRCPDCQKRIRARGLKDENELQRWLVLQIGAYLAARGRKTIVWNESLDGGLLPEHFIVQHWLGSKEATRAFMASGGRVISSEMEACYLSRQYCDLDLKDIWDAPDTPGYASEHPENLLGLECPLWTEQINGPERSAFMLFPRLPAIALRARLGGRRPGWEEYLGTVKASMERIRALGLSGAPEDLWVLSEDRRRQEREKMEARRKHPAMDATWRICDGLLRQEWLEKLLHRIRMPRPFALRVMDCALARIPEYCGQLPEGCGDGAEEMASQLLAVAVSREKGPWKDLPEDILLATMGCFTRFVNEHERATGRFAFDREEWTMLPVNARLFRVGELEYELCEEDRQKRISLHIPSDTHLKAGPLNDSVKKARDFLARYFPDWAGAPIRCESWLLSPVLRTLLPENAEIPRFQRAFDLEKVTCGGRDALPRVFGMTCRQAQTARPEDLPENTSLQRAVKALLLSGETVGTGGGVLARTFR